MTELVETVNIKFVFEAGFVLFILLSASVAMVFSVRSAHGPIEKRFVKRSCIGAWVILMIALVLAFSAPEPWGYLLLIPYGLHLPFAVYAMTNRQLLIRNYERMQKAVQQAAEGGAVETEDKAA